MSTRTLAVVSAGPEHPVVDPAAGRPAGRRDRRRRSRERGVDATVEVVELREHARDLADNLLTGFPTPRCAAAVDAVAGADGLIAVTPIFTASYSGLFKTFFDVLDKDALDRQAGADRARPAARPGTRWPSSTRCARCSPTCARSSCRPRCSPRPRTGPARRRPGAAPTGSTRAAGELADLVAGRPARPRRRTRSPTRRPRSRTCSAVGDPGGPVSARRAWRAPGTHGPPAPRPTGSRRATGRRAARPGPSPAPAARAGPRRSAIESVAAQRARRETPRRPGATPSAPSRNEKAVPREACGSRCSDDGRRPGRS